jgi:hypothetical protein
MTDYRANYLRKRISPEQAIGYLVALADIVVENTDRDNDWTDEISDNVSEALQALGVLTQCDQCPGGLMVSGGECPRDHPCSTCGYPIDDCQCCDECCCYPCECPEPEPEVEEEDA